MTEQARGVAVIGAGPAGLAAAWRLVGTGPVVVYEAGDRPGGRLRTEVVEGRGADAPIQLLSDGYDHTHGLLAAMGLGDRLMDVPGRDAVWRNGRPHGLHYGSAMSMAASGALPGGLKLRLGMRYLPFLDRHAGLLDLNDPGRGVSAGLDDESIAEWGRRELGADFVELMAYPLLAAYYGVTPEETSAALFHGLARAGLHVSVQGVHGGLGALADAMAEALTARGATLRLGAPVEAIEAGPSGVTIRALGRKESYDAAVVAVPAPAAAKILPDAGPWSEWLAGLPTRAGAHLVLALDRPLETGWFGLTVPRREKAGRELAAVCNQSAKGTSLPGDGAALVVVPAPPVAPDWAAADAATAAARALPVLERLLPGVTARVAGSALVPLAGAVVPRPGHFRGVRELDPAALPDTVALAGDYLVAPTVEGAVRSGFAAAERVGTGQAPAD